MMEQKDNRTLEEEGAYTETFACRIVVAAANILAEHDPVVLEGGHNCCIVVDGSGAMEICYAGSISCKSALSVFTQTGKCLAPFAAQKELAKLNGSAVSMMLHISSCENGSLLRTSSVGEPSSSLRLGRYLL